MKKKFDAVKFQRQQRERFSAVSAKMSFEEMTAYLDKSVVEFESERPRRLKRRVRVEA
jgi:hypothetical protein